MCMMRTKSTWQQIEAQLSRLAHFNYCLSHFLKILHLAKSKVGMADKVRPSFGFGAESVNFNTFGKLSVSVEGSHDSFSKLLVYAMQNFGRLRKYATFLVSTLFRNTESSSLILKSHWRPIVEGKSCKSLSALLSVSADNLIFTFGRFLMAENHLLI